jgi:outer membrane protein assembly factor BamB
VGTDDLLYVGTSMGGGGGFGGGGRPGGGGFGGGNSLSGTLFAVKPGAKGDITPKDGKKDSEGIAWSVAKAMPSAASPLVYDGLVYTFDRNGGTVSCFDAKTGDAKYSKERIPKAGAFWASPWAYDGKVFAIDESGTTHVIKAGSQFEVLSTNTLGKDMFWSSPAVSGGMLLIRGVDSLYGIK